MAIGGCEGDLNETVDDIVSMTSKMVSVVRRIGRRMRRLHLRRMWKGVGGWEVKILEEDEDDSFVGITFKSREDATGILQKQPWIFNGGLLLLERWPSSGQWREAKLDKVSCWVKMKGWPIKAFTRSNVMRLGEMAGEVQEIRWLNENRMFLNGFSIFVGRYIPCGGRKFWIQLKFERLPTLCFGCGVWGHEKRDCGREVLLEKNEDGLQVPKYGQWLKDEDPIPHCFSAFHQSRVGANEHHGMHRERDGGRQTEIATDNGQSVVAPPTRVTASEENPIIKDHATVMGSGDSSAHKTSTVGEGIINDNNMPGGIGRKYCHLLNLTQVGRTGSLNIIEPNAMGQPLKVNESNLNGATPGVFEKRLGGSFSSEGTEENETEVKKRKNGGKDGDTEEERERRALLKGKQIVDDHGVSSCGVGAFHHGEVAQSAKSTPPGQRKRLSIKNRARNSGKGRAMVLPTNGGVVASTVAGTDSIAMGQPFVFGSDDSKGKVDVNFWAVDRIGLSGGLLLLWKEELNVRVDSSSPGHVLARVAGKDFFPWTLTCFYGHPDALQRKFSWELLRNIRKEVFGPWLCIGDFNEVVSLSEKVGGRIRRDVAMEDFRMVIDDCRLIDFCSSKTELTWCNGHEVNPIMERLDRGLCNEEWLRNFNGADVSVLDWWGSDHRPLVVDIPIENDRLRCGQVKRKNRFHFEEAWCEEPECAEIVERVWDNEEVVNSTRGFKVKTGKVGAALYGWNKNKKKVLHEKTKKLKKAISELSL
ncbi:hypothetical protein F8388_006809 [Cannabis sativa]|uniref:CCHC-type domain-containing protein n=1 Tax=Cannabis sativa TaxID=3483 RepID=A0A7J6GV96_CANSA|nr:hypothetical protein F8388_006809 [Cannabis sativa]